MDAFIGVNSIYQLSLHHHICGLLVSTTWTWLMEVILFLSRENSWRRSCPFLSSVFLGWWGPRDKVNETNQSAFSKEETETVKTK